MAQLTAEQITGIQKFARQYQIETGDDFAAFLQAEVLDPIENSGVGYAALAQDVNAVGAPHSTAVRDTATGPGNTLVFAWLAFRVGRPAGYTTVAAGSLTLGSSVTNYIEVDPTTGTVSSNTSGFTTNRLPMFSVVTGASTYTDGNVTSVLAIPYSIGVGGIPGVLLTTPAKTKELHKGIATIPTSAGSLSYIVPVPTTIGTGTITKVRFVAKDPLATDNTNYAAFGVVNKTTTTTVVDITAAGNTTKTTGGSALVAYTPRDLTITSSAVAGGDVLEITVTGAGTLAGAVTEGAFLIEVSYVN